MGWRRWKWRRGNHEKGQRKYFRWMHTGSVWISRKPSKWQDTTPKRSQVVFRAICSTQLISTHTRRQPQQQQPERQHRQKWSKTLGQFVFVVTTPNATKQRWLWPRLLLCLWLPVDEAAVGKTIPAGSEQRQPGSIVNVSHVGSSAKATAMATTKATSISVETVHSWNDLTNWWGFWTSTHTHTRHAGDNHYENGRR